MTTEKKTPIAERIFNVVQGTPGLSEENIHDILSVDIKYKTASAKSLIYRMLRAKYLRKDKNGKFFAHIDAYKPLPPYKAKKKKVIDTGVKAANIQDCIDQARQYRESAAMNAYRHPPVTYVQLNPPAKKSFFTKLRELFA
jgi:hypothetical protein